MVLEDLETSKTIFHYHNADLLDPRSRAICEAEDFDASSVHAAAQAARRAVEESGTRSASSSTGGFVLFSSAVRSLSPLGLQAQRYSRCVALRAPSMVRRTPPAAARAWNCAWIRSPSVSSIQSGARRCHGGTVPRPVMAASNSTAIHFRP
jgi:hypothetical protein